MRRPWDIRKGRTHRLGQHARRQRLLFEARHVLVKIGAGLHRRSRQGA